MSKRTIKFSSLLVLITALLSAVFIAINLVLDFKFGEASDPSLIFGFFRTTVDLVAEYSAYAVVLFAFCHYPLKKAYPSLIIAGSSFLFAMVFMVFGTSFLAAIVDPENVDIWKVFEVSFLSALLGTFLERVVPCLLLAFISYLFTKNGNQKITKFITFKNPTQRSMLVFTLTMFTYNFVLTIVTDALYLRNEVIPEYTKTKFFDEFFGPFMLEATINYIVVIFQYLMLLYGVLFLVYYLECKVEENKQIFNFKKSKAVPTEKATLPTEEK